MTELPPRPPVLPPTINEEVFAPKRQMQSVRDAARKRLKKHHSKFEKLVRKFLKKYDLHKRYLQFYDIGYRYEAVFAEITTDGMDLLGEPLADTHAAALLEFLLEELRLPSGSDAIVLQYEKSDDGEILVLQMIAQAESEEIARLAQKVENAPRSGNPGQ